MYRDIVFENFTVEHAGTVFQAHAPAVAPLQDVTLRNISVADADTPLILENVEGLTFENVIVGQQKIDGILDWREARKAGLQPGLLSARPSFGGQ